MPVRISVHTLLIFLFDLLAVVVAWVGGLLIRFNLIWPAASGFSTSTFLILAALLPAHALACYWAGLYRGIWQFASVPDLKRVLRAITISAVWLLIIKALFFGVSGPMLPRSMLVLYPLLLAAIMCGDRLAWRIWKEYRMYHGLHASGKPVIIVGAGNSGKMLVHTLERRADWRVVALLDDDHTKWGRELYGIPVEGDADALPRMLKKYHAAHVILAMPSASPAAIKRVANIAVGADARVFIVPGIEELMCGRVEIDAMRPIEVEDLLGRESVHIDAAHVHQVFAYRTILVTGAGGSIGSELCRQLAKFEPKRLVLLEISEFALYSITEWFATYHPEVKIIPLISDIRNEARIEEIFSIWHPQAVFHAAAYKHVPLMESGNAWQAVSNNVFGTLRLARCAHRYGVERFVFISTDKAVNPTNIMGATKRLAEMVCEAFSVESNTRFGIVRFGNVLGSSGSVVPKFQAQIARGGPVTVTHPEITRYFMSIPEAAQLVLQAAAQEKNGEIFVLDMGNPVKIADLARNMIRLSGYTEAQISIEFTGLRPGEKLYEELLADTEQTLPTPHPKLRIARSRQVGEDFLENLQSWLEYSIPLDDDTVRRDIQQWVVEYTPSQPETTPLQPETDIHLSWSMEKEKQQDGQRMRAS
ncbi:MAG: polysaccharide biosynthesis protein [Betaproteobacteria bacterium]|nr:polysaccharide biosynthesis protein [Betaproteobacteria bacterium]